MEKMKIQVFYEMPNGDLTAVDVSEWPKICSDVHEGTAEIATYGAEDVTVTDGFPFLVVRRVEKNQSTLAREYAAAEVENIVEGYDGTLFNGVTCPDMAGMLLGAVFAKIAQMADPTCHHLGFPEITSMAGTAPENLFGQLFMDFLDEPGSALTMETKERLIKVAEYAGPDWAQAFYRAAVFMTKVA